MCDCLEDDCLKDVDGIGFVKFGSWCGLLIGSWCSPKEERRV